jgi:hypothetical protein
MIAPKIRIHRALGALFVSALALVMQAAPAHAGFLAGYGGNAQISATTGGIVDFAVVSGGMSDPTFASIYSHFSTAVSTPGGSATPGNYLYLYEVVNNTANTLQLYNMFSNTLNAANWGTFNGIALTTLPTLGTGSIYAQSVTAQGGLVMPSSVDNSGPFSAYFQFAGHKLAPGTESAIFGYTSNYAPYFGPSNSFGFNAATSLQGSGSVPASTPEPSALVSGLIAAVAALGFWRRRSAARSGR